MEDGMAKRRHAQFEYIFLAFVDAGWGSWGFWDDFAVHANRPC